MSLAYLSDLLLTSFFLQVGHSLLPDLRAVIMHSAQNLKWIFPILIGILYWFNYVLGQPPMEAFFGGHGWGEHVQADGAGQLGLEGFGRDCYLCCVCYCLLWRPDAEVLNVENMNIKWIPKSRFLFYRVLLVKLELGFRMYLCSS